MPRTSQRAAALVVASCAVLAAMGGCGDDEGGSKDDHASDQTVSPTPSASAPEPATEAGRGAVADLAARLGVAADQVVVVREEEVVWRNGSLGCAKPGFSYTEALVDGTRVVLEVAGETYEYHAGEGRAAFLCENPTQ